MRTRFRRNTGVYAHGPPCRVHMVHAIQGKDGHGVIPPVRRLRGISVHATSLGWNSVVLESNGCEDLGSFDSPSTFCILLPT